MIGWHHRLNGNEFEQAPGDSGGLRSLVCCSPRGHKELEENLMLGQIEGGRRRGQQRMRWVDGITHWMDMSVSKLREIVEDKGACILQSMGHK